MMTEFLAFAIFYFVVLVAFAGYVCLLVLAGWLRPRPLPQRRLEVEDGALPPVTMIVSTRDEAGLIAAKIENLLALDYPPQKVRILVVDGMSADGTPEILEGCRERTAGRRIDLSSMPSWRERRASSITRSD